MQNQCVPRKQPTVLTRHPKPNSDTRVQVVSTKLRELAFRKGPDAKLPTLRELCRTYEVSQSTISSVLDQLEEESVLYRKDRSGIFVSPQIHHKRYAVLLATSLFQSMGASPFWGMLWGQIANLTQERAAANSETFQFLLISEDDCKDPQSFDRYVRPEHLHGVLAVGFFSEAYVEWVRNVQVPVVAFAGVGHSIIEVDNRNIIRYGVDELAAAGCSKIGFWRFNATDYSLDWADYNWQFEDEIFHSALARNGLGRDDSLFIPFSQLREPHEITGPRLQEQGYRIAMHVLANPDTPKPDGVIITDDMAAFGVLQAMSRLKLIPGEDLRIASHRNRNSITLFGHEDQLILFDVDPAEIIAAMFERLDSTKPGGPVSGGIYSIQAKLTTPSHTE